MIRRLSYRLWLATAALLVTAALLITLARLLLPLAADYREDLVDLLSRQLGLPLAVESVAARWHGLGPRISFQGLTLRDREDTRDLLRLEGAMVDIDVPRSLWRGSLQVRNVVLDGVRLAVTRHADGSLSILGLRGAPGDAAIDARALLQWLTERRRITIQKGKVDWHDQLRQQPVRHFHDISFQLRNAGGHHRLEGQVRLSGKPAQTVSFVLKVRGDVTVPRGWDADLYFEASDVALDQLPWPLQAGGLYLARGRVTMRIWGAWHRARLQRLEGRVASQDLKFQRITGEARSLSLRRAGGDFLWRRDGRGWRLAIAGLEFARQGRSWPRSALQLQWRGTASAPERVAVRFGYLALEDARALLALGPELPAPWGEMLAGLDPRGALRDGYLFYHADAGDGGRFRARLRFEDLMTTPWHGIPGVRNLSGRVIADERGGMLALAGQQLAVDFAGLFRDSLAADVLTGRTYWLRTAQGWSVRGRDLLWRDSTLRFAADFDLTLPASETPRLDLVASFSAASLEQTARYLPMAMMRPGLVKWLDRAIVAGRVPGGEVRFHGPLNKTPFASGGDFEVRFKVLDGVLDYAPGWPRIEDIEAGFRFRKRRMEVVLADGKSLSSRIDNARITIADLAAHPAVLAVEGRARGPTADVLRFLRESPMRQRFAAYLSGLNAFGDARLDLVLHKPLAPQQPAEVGGVLALRNSILVVGGENPLEVKALDGELRFSGAGLYAEGLRGRLLGMESRFSVDTVTEGRDRVTYIRAAGRIDDTTIARLVPLSLFRHLSGETGWQATLRLPPPGEMPVRDGGGTLHIRSDLQGMAIALPEPLFKAPAETLELVLQTRLPRALDAPVYLQLETLFTGVLDLDSRLRLERGELLFGTGEPRLPDYGGLRLRGTWRDFSYSQWQPYLEETAGGTPLLRSLDLQLESLEVIGREFHEVALQGELGDDVWEFRATSRELRGYIEYPLTADLPLIMDLDYLRIPRQHEDAPFFSSEPVGAEDSRIDPREVPPLVVHSKRLDYGDIAFHDLVLRASKHPAGLRIDEMRLSSDVIDLRIHGTWVATEKEGQRSVFNIVFDSRDLGKALARLGFKDNIKGGRAHMELVGQWPGAPTSFAPARLNGNLKLRIENGRLLALEPGAGRIFGLVSLQALPRRLALDFSDIFDKGFSFDRIEGTFVIREGDALTRDLTMKGPAAEIRAEGRIGLRDRDYDQVVTVIPQVTSGLPVAGAVAGGIGVGAVILLAEQLLKEEIDKMTQVKYRVTGSWDEPQVERVLEAGKSKGQEKEGG